MKGVKDSSTCITQFINGVLNVNSNLIHFFLIKKASRQNLQSNHNEKFIYIFSFCRYHTILCLFVGGVLTQLSATFAIHCDQCYCQTKPTRTTDLSTGTLVILSEDHSRTHLAMSGFEPLIRSWYYSDLFHLTGRSLTGSLIINQSIYYR